MVRMPNITHVMNETIKSYKKNGLAKTGDIMFRCLKKHGINDTETADCLRELQRNGDVVEIKPGIWEIEPEYSY